MIGGTVKLQTVWWRCALDGTVEHLVPGEYPSKTNGPALCGAEAERWIRPAVKTTDCPVCFTLWNERVTP